MEYTTVSLVEPRCFIGLTEEPGVPPPWILYFLIAINVILCVSATFGNLLILVALQNNCRLHPPSKLLFRSLASTDLCVGLIAQPSFVIFLIFVVEKKVNLCEISEHLAHIFCAVLIAISLCTLTTISVDRLLALQLGLRYRRVLTLARVRGIIVLSWLLGFSLGVLYCWEGRVFLITVTVVGLLCFIVSTFCYVIIFITLRHRRALISQQGQTNNFAGQVLRYKKTVSKLLCISLVMVTFYLPFSIVSGVRVSYGSSTPINLKVTVVTSATIVGLNSSLNPFVYCWKIRVVRQAVKTTLRQLYAFCF